MDRRQFVKNSAAGLATLAATLGNSNPLLPELNASPQAIETLPGTQPLTWTDALDDRMMDGAHRYVEIKIDESLRTRQRHWSREMSSRGAYEKSIEPNRRRFMEKIGVVDPRMHSAMERFDDDLDPEPVAETGTYVVYQLRWPVLEGVSGEGLLLLPKGHPVARVVALPDADETPEQLVGLARGVDKDAQFARRLAENGCLVVVPTMVDRTTR